MNTRREDPCENLNHRRHNAPVRYCPDCGATVNAQQPASGCSTEDHDRARRGRAAFCVKCGKQLVGAVEQARLLNRGARR